MKNHWLLLFLCIFLCRAWDCFVRSLDHSYLGSLLSHVIVALLPLIHIQPKETTAVFYFLIVENRYHTKYFHFVSSCNRNCTEWNLSSTEIWKFSIFLWSNNLFYKISTLNFKEILEFDKGYPHLKRYSFIDLIKNIWRCDQVTASSECFPWHHYWACFQILSFCYWNGKQFASMGHAGRITMTASIYPKVGRSIRSGNRKESLYLTLFYELESSLWRAQNWSHPFCIWSHHLRENQGVLLILFVCLFFDTFFLRFELSWLELLSTVLGLNFYSCYFL